MTEHIHEKKLKQAEIGAISSLIAVALSLGFLSKVQYDPRSNMKAPGGAQFRIFSDPPEAKILLVNNQGQEEHKLGLTNSRTLTVQDFLNDGEKAAPNWSYKVRLEKEGCTPAEVTVSEAEARTGFIPSAGKPLPELRIESPSAFGSYLWNYRKGPGLFLLLGLVGLAVFGWQVKEGRRKRQVYLRYEADPDSDDYIGKILHEHLVIGFLGKGGYGKVYRVLDEQTLDEKNAKALKIVSYEDLEALLKSDNREKAAEDLRVAKERFMREMETFVTSDHPNICKVYKYGREKQHDWVLMPVYEKSLHTLINSQEPLSPKKILSIAKQLADGLQYAHDHKITHRDLKPDNVMLNGDQVVIIDFGIAKPKDKETITAVENMLGTIKYVAPEQTAGNSETTVDQYPYGLILFELLTRDFPFPPLEDQMQMLMQRLQGQPRTLRETSPQYSEELDAVISRMLNNDPAKRFPTITEAYQAFQAAYLAGVTNSELAGS